MNCNYLLKKGFQARGLALAGLFTFGMHTPAYTVSTENLLKPPETKTTSLEGKLGILNRFFDMVVGQRLVGAQCSFDNDFRISRDGEVEAGTKGCFLEHRIYSIETSEYAGMSIPIHRMRKYTIITGQTYRGNMITLFQFDQYEPGAIMISYVSPFGLKFRMNEKPSVVKRFPGDIHSLEEIHKSPNIITMVPEDDLHTIHKDFLEEVSVLLQSSE